MESNANDTVLEKPTRADYNNGNKPLFPNWLKAVSFMISLVGLVSVNVLTFFRVYEATYMYTLGKFAEQRGVITAIDLTRFTVGINSHEQVVISGILLFMTLELHIIICVSLLLTGLGEEIGINKVEIVGMTIFCVLGIVAGSSFATSPNDLLDWVLVVMPPLATVLFSVFISILVSDYMKLCAKSPADFTIVLEAWKQSVSKREDEDCDERSDEEFYSLIDPQRLLKQ